MASSADIKMNEFATATDGAYIYAEAADGSQVKISKASLASLIKTLIGEATSSASGLMSASDKKSQFKAKGWSLYEINNADTATDRGIYRFNAASGEESTRNPILGNKWGILIVFTAHSDMNPIAQLFIPSSNNFICLRQNYNYGGIAGVTWNRISFQ